jgi:large subunit ribosomal protein L25
MLTLQAQTREANASVDTLRTQGFMPAVFYGPKEAPVAIAVRADEFGKLWHEVGGSAIVDLQGSFGGKEVLIHDVQVHPVTNMPLHADFYVIEKGKKVSVTIPLEFVGTAPAEKLGGIVVKVMHEIDIEVEPREIPQSIEVDVSKLETLESEILFKDLPLPASAESTIDPDEVIVSVALPVEEKEETPMSVADVEIEEKGKKEEAPAAE